MIAKIFLTLFFILFGEEFARGFKLTKNPIRIAKYTPKFQVQPASNFKCFDESYSKLFAGNGSSDEDPAERERRILAQKKAEYEEKLLRDAMQVTKNQEKFFSVGKFLLPLVVIVWIYSFFAGSSGNENF